MYARTLFLLPTENDVTHQVKIIAIEIVEADPLIQHRVVSTRYYCRFLCDRLTPHFGGVSGTSTNTCTRNMIDEKVDK